MSFCPQCGEQAPQQAVVCPTCGGDLATVVRPAGGLGAVTMVGVARTDLASPLHPAAAMPLPRDGRTLVGGSPPPRAPAAAPPAAPATKVPAAAARTMMGVGSPDAQLFTDESATVALPPARRAPKVGEQTQVGGSAKGFGEAERPPAPLPFEPAPAPVVASPIQVAPPIAARPIPPPPRSSSSRGDPPGYQPAQELGATMNGAVAVRVPPQARKVPEHLERRYRGQRDLKLRPPAKKAAAAPPADKGTKKAILLLGAGGAVGVAAVVAVLFWPSAPAISGRPRTDPSGKDGVELTCTTCPDGTVLTVGTASATVTAGGAFVPLPAPLPVGGSRLDVAIDRPGNGRDERVAIPIQVGYRIRPDLATLQAERPSFQIVAEAPGGASVTLDGKKLQLSGGRAVENLDVTEACTGLATEVKTLSRQVPYVVTPEGGSPEQGVVSVSVGVVPLSLDAPVPLPGASSAAPPHVTVEGSSFTIAGTTMKGAEVVAAGRPIPVRPDGSFAQVMNVSSVGQTVIEVRAKMPGMAPRISQIRVRRVESLKDAAREFSAGEPPLGIADLGAGLASKTGKPVVLTGEVSDVKKQGYQTIMTLDVGANGGCPAGACTARLVQGSDSTARKGDRLQVFGHLARAFTVPGKADVPEVEVDFTLLDNPAAPTAGAKDLK